MQDLLGYSGLLASLTYGLFAILPQQFMQYINIYDIHLALTGYEQIHTGGPVQRQLDS